MTNIISARKLLDIAPDTDLGKLKVTYRNLMKEWHPDKFQDEKEKAEAEVKSKSIIEAYHFLVSVSPETHALNVEEYTNSTNSGIPDFQYKGQNLKVYFNDGSVYEYFGVPKNIYNKLISSSTITRFARRHIFESYVYRKVTKSAVEV